MSPNIAVHRGAGFSGVIELVVALGLAVGVVVDDPGLGFGPAVLTTCLLLCALSAAAGRFPYVGSLAATLALCLSVAAFAADADKLGMSVLCTFVVVEAVATTGRRWWIIGITGVHIIVWLLMADSAQEPPTAGGSIVIITVFGASIATGVLRYQLRTAHHRHQQARDAELATMRQDIARDLHDSVAHDLTIMVLRAAQARTSQHLDPQAREHLDYVVSTGQQSVHDLHAMLAVLRQRTQHSLREPGDPVDALESAKDRLSNAGFEADIRYSDLLDELPPLIGDALTKCLFEAVNNVIRHGEPGTTCTIRVDIDESVEAIVLNTAPQTRSGHDGSSVLGLGIVGMVERVESVGGTLEVGPRGDNLFALVITIPLCDRLSF